MPFKIVFASKARTDIQDAIDWENSRADKLGERFLEYLYKKLAALSVTPLIGSIHNDKIRYTTTEVFQYLIYYKVDEQARIVIIWRILHVRRKPVE